MRACSKKHSFITGLLVLSLFVSWLIAPVQAEPADWYRWQSKQSGRLICKQTDPGPGWQRFSGPFLDGGCRLVKKTSITSPSSAASQTNPATKPAVTTAIANPSSIALCQDCR